MGARRSPEASQMAPALQEEEHPVAGNTDTVAPRKIAVSRKRREQGEEHSAEMASPRYNDDYSDACVGDARTLCTADAELLALLEQQPARDEDKITKRRQRVRECLVIHAEELSPQCVHALVGNVATTANALPPAEAGADGAHVQAGENTTEEKPATIAPRQSSLGAPRLRSVAAPASAPQPIALPTTSDDAGIEVRIYLINHPGNAPAGAAAPYITIGGGATQYTDNTDHTATTEAASGMAMPAWLWVMMLPFLCVGIYVSVQHAIAFVRRRRDVVYRVGATQYTPIASTLGGKQ